MFIMPWDFSFISIDHVILYASFRRVRSQSCPFCRDSLKRMDSGELWIYTSNFDIIDLSTFAKENLKRLFMYIEKLPLIVPDPMVVSYDPRFLWRVLFLVQRISGDCRYGSIYTFYSTFAIVNMVWDHLQKLSQHIDDRNEFAWSFKIFTKCLHDYLKF